MRDETLYFGRPMAFTDKAGINHPDAFWHMELQDIDTNNRSMSARFTGYHSVEDFRNNSPSLASVGGFWAKTFTGEAYDRLIALYAQQVAGVAQAWWDIALSIKDTPNMEGVYESFFESAGDIIAPV